MATVAIKTTRPKRTNINGQRNVLTVKGKDPSYEYRIVNDTGDRVASMEGIGYEIVTDQGVQVGDRRIANPTKEGSPIKVSVGGGTQAYVMRIKKEWYEEDQAAKSNAIKETEKGLAREAKQNSDYGKLTIG